MSRVKSAEKKARLSSALKKNRRLPLFVIAKSKRKVTAAKRRHWRSQKLKLHSQKNLGRKG
ncbi:50S ribosomal protein L39e [Candidatus Micrarchaeota archaeon]|nr:50S ribosomal protein L39e [Candidatus Micrarchaeota archaeon]